jgi:DNA-binding NarL/FixJ family response regulator
MWRDGLRAILGAHADLEVLGDPNETGGILTRISQSRPDVVVCQFSTAESALPDFQELLGRGIPFRIVVFDSADASPSVPRLLLQEIAQIIALNSPTDALLSVIRKLDRDRRYDAPAPVTPANLPSRPGPLSRRERELVGLIALGYRNREIADKLFISEQTVKNHLHNVFDKTGIKDRLELALYAVYNGLYQTGV